MTPYIWSLPKLEENLNHPEPSVQEWATSKLFALYAEEAEKRLPWLLADERPAIVAQALEHLGKIPRTDLIPLLGRLFLQENPTISTRALMVLANWRVSRTVDWIKERILQHKTLGKEQIASMIYALGRIQTQDAYTLLKQTEESIRDKASAHWQTYYSSLLQHRRLEDVKTLLAVTMDEAQSEERRREALGLLLSTVDLHLNPSDVFFANHPATRKYWLNRVDELGEADGAEPFTPFLKSIRDLVEWLKPELVPGSIPRLEELAAGAQGLPEFERGLFLASVRFLKEKSGKTEWHYGLVSLALSGLFAALEAVISPPPSAGADWREACAYLLRNRPTGAHDDLLQNEVVRAGDREELTSLLISVLRETPESWGALRAVQMLGELKATESVPDIVSVLSSADDELLPKAAATALTQMGSVVVPMLLPWVGGTDLNAGYAAMNVLAELPTQEAVTHLVSRFRPLYDQDASLLLETLYEMGAAEFLDLLTEEYRPDESEIARTMVHICRVNGLKPPQFRELERVVKRADTLVEEQRRIFSGEVSHWPATIQLELACRECGKKYTYEIHEVHMHPKAQQSPQRSGGDEEDLTPFRQGLVICDDIRCKNCGVLNRVQLTQKTLAQLTAESVRLLAFRRAGLEVPSSYPLKHVQLDEREGEPLTLLNAEQEHLNAVELASSKPGTHLALGKFYEYVKEFSEAKQAYLRAVDLDAKALEAFAGLARLAHAEGDLTKAGEWIEDCYQNLEEGHLYLAKEAQEFKKAVRSKRQEYLREAGIKAKDKPVKIRFSVDVPEYPKNRPCPCGSGKKFKMCCMKTTDS